LGGGQKHAFQEDSAFANADEYCPETQALLVELLGLAFNNQKLRGWESFSRFSVDIQ